jgi:hypothetical protein
MEEKEDAVKIFKINILLILKNFVLVAAILVVCAIFLKGPWYNVLYLTLISGFLYLLYYILSKTLISIKVYTKDHKVNFQFSRFIFLRSEYTLGANEFFYSFNEEIGARGSKHPVFNVYNADKEKIVKINPYSSGWRTERIMAIIFLWQELGVKEYKDQI